MSGHAALRVGDRRGTVGPDARQRLLASHCFRAYPSHQPAGMNRFCWEANSSTGSSVFFQVPRADSAQLPEGVGSSRPLVSRTSGAGGASSPAMTGVIAEGTEAIVVAGLPGR